MFILTEFGIQSTVKENGVSFKIYFHYFSCFVNKKVQQDFKQ